MKSLNIVLALIIFGMLPLSAESTYNMTTHCSYAPGVCVPSSTADFTYNHVPCSFSVEFTAEDFQGSDDYTHYWYFGDGGESNQENPTHIFPAADDYTVIHQVLKNDGTDFKQETKVISIPDNVPFGKALFEFTIRTCDDQFLVYFYSYNEIGTHTWDFGDNSTGSGPYTEHEYDEAGEYSVTHTVVVGTCTYTKTYVVDIQEGCINIGTDGQTTYFEDFTTGAGALLPAQTAENLYICFHGTIVLTTQTEEYRFKNCNIQMSPGSKIVVEEDTELGFGSTSYLYACDGMWQGIEVEGGGTLLLTERSFVEDAQYAVYAHDDATLQLTNFFNRNYISLYIPASSTQQKLNLISPIWNIRFYCFQQLNTPYNNANGQQQYEPGLPTQGDYSYAGIVLNNVGSISIGSELPIYNYFYDHANGIILNDVDFAAVQNNLMKNILETNDYPGQSGRGIYCKGSGTQELFERGTGIISSPSYPLGSNYHRPPAFENVTTGILTEGVGVTAVENTMITVKTGIDVRQASIVDVDIRDNQIEARTLGIAARLCNGNKEFRIKENYIETGLSGIGTEGILVDDVQILPFNVASVENNRVEMGWCEPEETISGIAVNLTNNLSVTNNEVFMHNPQSSSSFDLYGIALSECEKLKVSCNEVEAFGLTGWFNRGIRFYSTDNALVSCNSTDKTGYGIEFYGTNANIDFIGNYFNEHFFGLYVPESSVITPIGGGIIKHSFKGNEWWYNPYNGTDPNLAGALHEGDYFNVTASAFEVYPNYTFSNPTVLDPEPWLTPQVNTSVFEWFAVPPSPPSEQEGCTLDCSPGLFTSTTPEVSLLDEYIAQEKPLWDSTFTGAKWNAQQYLFAKLKADSSLITPATALDTFFDAALTGNFEDFLEINEDIETIRRASQATVNQYQTQQEEVLELLDTLLKVEMQWFVADSSQKAALAAIRSSFLDSLEGHTATQASYLKNQLESMQTGAGSTSSQNGGLSAASNAELKEQKINDIYLNTLALGVDTFSATQISSLEQIAFDCPLVGGKAVYRARAMYRLLVDTTFYEGASCIQASSSGKETKEEKEWSLSAFDLYPNPAQDQITITSSFDTKGSSILAVLYDASGRPVKSFKLITGRQSWQLDVSDLPAGMYMLSTLYPANVRWSTPVMINR
jgi:PKD repeat protein